MPTRLVKLIYVIAVVLGMASIIYLADRQFKRRRPQVSSEVLAVQLREWGEKKLLWCKQTCPPRTDAGITSDGHCICLGWPIPCPVEPVPAEEIGWPSPP